MLWKQNSNLGPFSAGQKQCGPTAFHERKCMKPHSFLDTKVELQSQKWHCRTLIWPPCTRIAWSSAGTTDCPIATTYTISIIIIMTDSVPWRGSVSSAICRGKCSRTTTETVWHGDVPGRMPMPLIRRRQVVGDAGVPAPGRKWTNSWKVPLAMKLHAKSMEFVIQIQIGTMAQ